MAAGTDLVYFVVFFELWDTVSTLTCYSCNTTDRNDLCYWNVSETPEEVCDPTATSCSVYREERNGAFTFVIRGCNSSCEETCGVWGGDADGEENVDIDKCSSCCDSDLCNVDDGAVARWMSSPSLMWLTMAADLIVVNTVLFSSSCSFT